MRLLPERWRDEATGGICGVPDLATTAAQSIANLHDNLNLGQAGQNLQNNFDAGAAAGNLQHALTNGVGSEDQNAQETPVND